MRKTSDVIKIFSCVGLDCEIRAHFFSPRSLAVNGLDLTQISQIPLNCTPDVKSHRGFAASLESLFNPIFTPILSILTRFTPIKINKKIGVNGFLMD